jgi:protein-S-isoprenylcysteine O-methyltransferase Ste14
MRMTDAGWLVLKNLLFTVVVPGTAAVYLPVRIARSASPAGGLASVAGLLLLAVGAGGYLWCQWHFAATGRGTPAPIDPPRQLVIRGPFRVVRNPMYLSVLVTVVGWAVFYRSAVLLWYAGALWIGFHLFVIFYEEPVLQRQFGESYAQYRRTVRRWMPTRPGP